MERINLQQINSIKYNLNKRGNPKKEIGTAVIYLGDKKIGEEKIYAKKKKTNSIKEWFKNDK